ncbi:hypothetical protein [Planctomycetes bacterium TBK1r]|uniref:Uncharacterized protein n=1 Tax=Stieleria magnilauensis TaxID=2527963 RepID=A0ABX5XKS7_9BACT|nr:hypothetical protein TBK1r_01560 [Planctomycetes bacterium TBK1r]
MSHHLPRLHNIAHAVFDRCGEIRGRNDVRADARGRAIRLSDFGDDNSDYGWLVHRNDDGAYVALHIESFCDDAHDYLIASLSDEQSAAQIESLFS